MGPALPPARVITRREAQGSSALSQHTANWSVLGNMAHKTPMTVTREQLRVLLQFWLNATQMNGVNSSGIHLEQVRQQFYNTSLSLIAD